MRDHSTQAAYEAWLARYFEQDPPTTRLLDSEVRELLLDGYPEGFGRFLIARAHNSEQGRKLSKETVAIRETILELQESYEVMTVRQVFYALTVRGIVPKTEATGYVPVQRQVLELRRQGFLPWGFIADGTRWARAPETWDSTEDALRETARLYRRNLWRSQGVRLEFWLEKDALAGVLSGVTYSYGVRLMVSRGQASDTYCYTAAREAKKAWNDAKVETAVYALYDSDKSGRSAAEKVEEKLRAYSDDAPITFELLAVTDEQIEEWELPTRPAKEAGEPDAVELDAIPPERLTGLVETAIRSHIDHDAWEKEEAVEASERELLEQMAGKFIDERGEQ